MAASLDTRRAPTLATVADAVGVSRMTVSNAFNRPDQLSPALRERILAAARELGYAGPNPVARTLSKGRTGSVGLVFDLPLTQALTDSATLQFVHGVATVCEERGMALSLVPKIDGRDAQLVHTALVDGFVVYCMAEADPRLDAIRGRRVPYVLIDHQPDPEARIVNIDDRGGARAAAEHMLALGHRRFGVVLGFDKPADTALGVQQTSPYHVDTERLAGWQDALEAAGLDWASVPLGTAPGDDRETGRAAGGALLDRADRPTAILALTDVLALGVLEAAAERGLAVPGDVSVAGFDDTPESALSTPSLTTVRQSHVGKGAAAVRLLLDATGPQTVLLPTELVPRESSASPPVS
jgi:DNA-binding LacI/PurR family transcriptional regulator